MQRIHEKHGELLQHRKENDMPDIKYELINEIGVVSERKSGWRKELNRISWAGQEPKYDLREWSENHEKMGKGMTLSEEELRSLYKIIKNEIELIDAYK